MVILGLGTNLGDRLENLRRAFALLKKIPHFAVQQVSPIYTSDALLPENATADWNTPYLNLALRCETTLNPHDLLAHLKQIEKLVGRVPNEVWGPRIMDIDLLAWDDRLLHDEKLHVPHKELTKRPFALWPLADVAPFWTCPLPGEHHGKTALEIIAPWGSRFSGNAPLHTRQIAQRIDTPQLVGILNITPNSFSDGGDYLDPAAAITHAQQLVENGAEIIDIGAEATNPKAAAISVQEEWQRLEPVLTTLRAQTQHLIIPPKISLDTRHPEIAKKALALGVDWINDVTGLTNPVMCEIVAEHTCDVIVMHSLGVPVDKNNLLPLNESPITQILRWAEQRLKDLAQYGIKQERIILDVGIGFGKNAEQSLALIKHISHFHALGCRLLVGHSRKTFINQFTDKPFAERDIETLILSLFLANQSVDYLRVHQVAIHGQAFRVAKMLQM